MEINRSTQNGYVCGRTKKCHTDRYRFETCLAKMTKSPSKMYGFKPYYYNFLSRGMVVTYIHIDRHMNFDLFALLVDAGHSQCDRNPFECHQNNLYIRIQMKLLMAKHRCWETTINCLVATETAIWESLKKQPTMSVVHHQLAIIWRWWIEKWLLYCDAKQASQRPEHNNVKYLY